MQPQIIIVRMVLLKILHIVPTHFFSKTIYMYMILLQRSFFGKVVARVRGQGSGGTENIQANAPMPQPPRRDQSRTIYDHMW